MARRRQFVSTGLHNISKHIAESTSGKGVARSEVQEEDVETLVEERIEVAVADSPQELKPKKQKVAPVIVEEPVAELDVSSETEVVGAPSTESLMAHKRGHDLPERREKEKQKAVKRRANEFVGARRDMMTRLSQSLAIIPDDIEECEMRIKLLKQYKETYENLVLKLEPLDENAWSDEDYSLELGKAMKIIDNSRLEYMSAAARLEKMMSGEESAVAVQSSFVADIASLSFGQLFRIGLIASLPVIGGLIFSAVIIALSYLVIVS